VSFLAKIKAYFIDKAEDIQYYAETYGWFYALVTRPWNAYVWKNVLNVVTIIQWIPTLWNDTDWNDKDILRVLDYKLSRVRRELEKGYGADDWKKERFAEIDEVRALFSAILEGEFVSAERAAHREKYGEINMNSEPTDDPRLSRCIFTYSKVDKNDAAKMEEASQESYKISMLEEQREKEAYEKAFKLIAENSRKWWD